jgi:hypothetical protein
VLNVVGRKYVSIKKYENIVAIAEEVKCANIEEKNQNALIVKVLKYAYI